MCNPSLDPEYIKKKRKKKKEEAIRTIWGQLEKTEYRFYIR